MFTYTITLFYSTTARKMRYCSAGAKKNEELTYTTTLFSNAPARKMRNNTCQTKTSRRVDQARPATPESLDFRPSLSVTSIQLGPRHERHKAEFA
mmetsp:Transcript_27636/g.66408  ORF Transcript_27636/g.66408 Transcript_27636/m.66408 type:complete len:95 (-) Transcript_27636:419-703(-)